MFTLLNLMTILPNTRCLLECFNPKLSISFDQRLINYKYKDKQRLEVYLFSLCKDNFIDVTNCHVSFSDATGDRSRYNLLRNQMISSAIWDKSEPVNFSGLTKFAVLIKFSRADLSQITQEKSCGYLLIIYMQKCESLFLFYVSPHITVPCSRLQMTTTIKSGQNFDRRILECLERKF